MTKLITALIFALAVIAQSPTAVLGGSSVPSPIVNGEDPDRILCWLMPSLFHHHD